jgi:hypothetical protein
MIKLVGVTLFAILSCLSLSGQTLTGVVSDQATNEPLPYVHIGVIGKNMGVISRDDGSYEIVLTNASPDDVLAFSIIGYDTKRFTVADVKDGRMDVRLPSRTYLLKEVVIRPKNEKPKTEKLGRYTPTKTTQGQSGKMEFGFGGEWGLRVSPQGRKLFVDDLRFHMRFNTVDSILFRLNFYRVENGMPGESILQHELFMTGKKKQKWITRDLVKENLIVDQDLIVTVEVVRIFYSKSGENQIFFTEGEGYDEGHTFYRASSQDAWTVDQYAPATLYLTVEEF